MQVVERWRRKINWENYKLLARIYFYWFSLPNWFLFYFFLAYATHSLNKFASKSYYTHFKMHKICKLVWLNVLRKFLKPATERIDRLSLVVDTHLAPAWSAWRSISILDRRGIMASWHPRSRHGPKPARIWHYVYRSGGKQSLEWASCGRL